MEKKLKEKFCIQELWFSENIVTDTNRNKSCYMCVCACLCCNHFKFIFKKVLFSFSAETRINNRNSASLLLRFNTRYYIDRLRKISFSL